MIKKKSTYYFLPGRYLLPGYLLNEQASTRRGGDFPKHRLPPNASSKYLPSRYIPTSVLQGHMSGDESVGGAAWSQQSGLSSLVSGSKSNIIIQAAPSPNNQLLCSQPRRQEPAPPPCPTVCPQGFSLTEPCLHSRVSRLASCVLRLAS